MATPIDADMAIAISLRHGMMHEGLAFPESMVPAVRDAGSYFEVWWRPRPKEPGFEYRVQVDKDTGEVMQSE